MMLRSPRFSALMVTTLVVMLSSVTVWRIAGGGLGQGGPGGAGQVGAGGGAMCADPALGGGDGGAAAGVSAAGVSGSGVSGSGYGAIDFFTGGGRYMPRTHCMVTQDGSTDWAWVWVLVGLNGLIIAGYAKIFVFWRQAYLVEAAEDRNTKLMDLAWMFLLCASCGYLSSIVLFFWPGYRLLAVCLVPLAFVTWKFAANLEDFKLSLGAKRLARQLNESLSQQNERLAAQVESATADLQLAKLHAEQANRAKSEFLARMSHEIRTPMSAILGYVDIALEEEVTERHRLDCLQTVRSNSEHLLNLINDVLDVSKIEAGEMSYERIPCSIHDIVERVAALMRSKASLKGVAVEATVGLSVPGRVVTDPTRVRQMVTNLVGNAIKFTADGVVTIGVEARRIEDGRAGEPAGGPVEGVADGGTTPSADTLVTVTVRDTGIGMTGEQMSRIFDLFSQGGTSIAREYGGSGLGLTIARRIANDLGGELRVESEYGRGSSFAASFACQTTDYRYDPPQERIAPSSARRGALEKMQAGAAALSGCRVLLVEDSEDNHRLIRYYFESIGVRIEHAGDGVLGLGAVERAAAAGDPFGIIIMDINMPNMDGIACTRQIRALGIEAPIVMLSAHAMAQEHDRSMNAGASAYCTKPIDFPALVGVCAALVERGSSRAA